jgi:glycerate dehydrogenase
LKYLTINSTGYDVLDLQAAKAHNIQVSNIPEYTTEAVAEHTLALILATTRHIVQLDKKMHEKPYEIDPSDTSQLQFLGVNLKDKTLGIIGLGKIGQRVAEIAHGIGMQVIAYNRSQKNINYVKQVSLEELLKESDVVSLHTPLNESSENMIKEKELAMMKSHAILINTARGKIVDTEALVAALRNKKIGGAGIDTLAEWDKLNPLLSFENIILSPHSAWYTNETFENLANMVVENIESFAKGQPQNLIG